MNGDVYRGDDKQNISIYREHPGLMRPPNPKWIQPKPRVYSMPWGWVALAAGFTVVIMVVLAMAR